MIRKEEHKAQLSEKPLQAAGMGKQPHCESWNRPQWSGPEGLTGCGQAKCGFCRKLLGTARDGGGD